MACIFGDEVCSSCSSSGQTFNVRRGKTVGVVDVRGAVCRRCIDRIIGVRVIVVCGGSLFGRSGSLVGNSGSDSEV
jgi:hypothetical protein